MFGRGVLWIALPAMLLAPVWVPSVNHPSTRVAFEGDSLTHMWAFPRTNLGIYGQTTDQILSRFPSEVDGHGFDEVVILGGTNDVLLGVKPETTVANLNKMIDVARAGGVDPVLSEIPPIYKDRGKYSAATQELNRQIVALADARQVKLVDYYDALNGHPHAYSDGVHLKRSGYLRMELALLKEELPF